MCVACERYEVGEHPAAVHADCVPGKYREMLHALRGVLASAPNMPTDVWPEGFVPTWAIRQIVDLYREEEAEAQDWAAVDRDELREARRLIGDLEERLTQWEEFLADTERSYDMQIGALNAQIRSLDSLVIGMLNQSEG